MSSPADNMKQHDRHENNWGQQCGENNSEHEEKPKGHRGKARQLHAKKKKQKSNCTTSTIRPGSLIQQTENEAHPLN